MRWWFSPNIQASALEECSGMFQVINKNHQHEPKQTNKPNKTKANRWGKFVKSYLPHSPFWRFTVNVNTLKVLCFRKSDPFSFWGLTWFICSSLASFGWPLESQPSPDRLQSVLSAVVLVGLVRLPACLRTHRPPEPSSGRSALCFSGDLWPFHERRFKEGPRINRHIHSFLPSSQFLFLSSLLLPFAPSFLLCQCSPCSLLLWIPLIFSLFIVF